MCSKTNYELIITCQYKTRSLYTCSSARGYLHKPLKAFWPGAVILWILGQKNRLAIRLLCALREYLLYKLPLFFSFFFSLIYPKQSIIKSSLIHTSHSMLMSTLLRDRTSKSMDWVIIGLCFLVVGQALAVL